MDHIKMAVKYLIIACIAISISAIAANPKTLRIDGETYISIGKSKEKHLTGEIYAPKSKRPKAVMLVHLPRVDVMDYTEMLGMIIKQDGGVVVAADVVSERRQEILMVFMLPGPNNTIEFHVDRYMPSARGGVVSIHYMEMQKIRKTNAFDWSGVSRDMLALPIQKF